MDRQSTPPDRIDHYKERIVYCDGQIKRYNRSINTYSLFRLLIVVLGFILIYQALEVQSIFLTFLAFLSTVVVFTGLVRKHSQLYARREYFQNLRTVNQNEINSIENRTNLYPDGEQWCDEKHAYSSDLDIFGSKSLYQLVNRAATHGGNKKLAEWLSGAAEKKVIEDRQEAIRELATKSGWVQDIQAKLLFHNKKDDELVRLFSYLNTTPLFGQKTALKKYVAAAPYIFAVIAVLSLASDNFRPLLLLLGLVNGGLILFNLSRINRTDQLIGRAGAVLKSFGDVFRCIEAESWNAALAKQLQASIGVGGKHPLSHRIAELSKLIDKLDYRLNIFVSLILNYIFVWDLRQVFALEAWKEKNKHNLEVAFDVVAELEALISLSSLHTNNPTWSYPLITDNENYTLIARELAHPLISPATRVANDFVLKDDRIIEIVTGSNMAGKSTFLRTVGINAVLAFAGAPVCAQRFEVSLMRIVSYMRIKDSLNESTSTFKAELDRLQMILNIAQRGEKAYFLIDEMLRGTNSVDKYRGSKAVIRKLLTDNAAGMVATHDLQLAKLEQEHPGRVRNYHFDIQIENGEMHFDYKLKEGECATFNASILLQKIGVEV